MKKPTSLLLVCLATGLLCAQDASKKKSAPNADADTAPSIAATAAKVTPPLAVNDGVLSQPNRTDLPDGGKAVFEFTVAKDGDYEVHAVVDAPDDENNSFYVNIDAEPDKDPLMIWDIDHTKGFEERVVNWRGDGEAGSDQFDPKIFKLAAGTHKLHLVGREPAKLKSVSIHAVKK